MVGDGSGEGRQRAFVISESMPCQRVGLVVLRGKDIMNGRAVGQVEGVRHRLAFLIRHPTDVCRIRVRAIRFPARPAVIIVHEVCNRRGRQREPIIGIKQISQRTM